MGKIKFKHLYEPVKFGDRRSTKTVDRKRIAALRAAESRTAQMVRQSAVA